MDQFTDSVFIKPPRAKEHVFVLVALVSHEKLDLRYFNRASATCFRNFSLNKVLITFRNVRGLQGTNSSLSRTVTCRATLLSERVLISRTILRLLRFVVLCKNEVKNQNSALKAAHGNFSGNSCEGLIQIGQLPASNTRDKV